MCIQNCRAVFLLVKIPVGVFTSAAFWQTGVQSIFAAKEEGRSLILVVIKNLTEMRLH